MTRLVPVWGTAPEPYPPWRCPWRRGTCITASPSDPDTETATPDSYILIEGGRIAAIGQGMPTDVRDAVLHDFRGLWALPGLIDTHAHVTLGPVNGGIEDGQPYLSTTPDDAILAYAARTLLSFGVTTIRNPGGPAAVNARYARELARGERLGPEMLWAGEIVDNGPFAFKIS